MKKHYLILERFASFFLFLILIFLGINKVSAQTLTVTATVTQAPCDHDGIITASVTGGTPPYQYSWTNYSTGLTTVTATNTFTGYSGVAFIHLTVQDAAGLLAWTNVLSNTQPFGLEIDTTNANPAICPLNNGSLALTITGGTAPFSYIWYDNGAVIANTSVPILTNLSAGANYDVEVTDANGCKLFYHDINSYFAVQSTTNIQPNPTSTPAACYNGTATVNPTGGQSPYTYSWQQIYPNPQPLSTTTNVATNLSHNHYYGVWITDGNGCTQYQSFSMPNNIFFYVQPNISPATCLNANGAISLNIIPSGTGATYPPYTFSWSNGATASNIQNVFSGAYNCVVTDAIGCQFISMDTVPTNSPILMNLIKTTTSNCLTPNGTASVSPTGGQAPYTYSWNTGQTTSSISGLNVNTPYSIMVTDANGCTQHENFYIYYANAGTYQQITTPDTCNTSDGTATAIITGGVAPFSFSWNNGQTSQTAINLASGWYYCNITDANGCPIPATNYSCVHLEDYSPMALNTTITNASCIYTSDGIISLNPSGGTSPYQYSWNGTTQSGATANNLAVGTYSVIVSDAAGCESAKSFQVNYNNVTNCTSIIHGYVYQDLNLNCIQDAGENGVEGVQVYCSTLGLSVITDNIGMYYFNVPVGTYQIEHFPLPYYSDYCANGPLTVNVPAVGMNIAADFGEKVTWAQDLEIGVYHLNMPIWGSSNYTQLQYAQNVGTLAVSAPSLHLHTDSSINFNLSAGFSASGSNYYTKNYPSLSPNQYITNLLQYSIPLTTPLNTFITFTDSISPTQTNEATPWNNSIYYTDVIVGAFDPNNKEVFPKGKGEEGFITPEDSVLKYVVHFQNTGNYPASKVIIMDTLDNDLDWKTFRMGYSTHYCTNVQILDNHIVKITFDGINLPYSSQNYLWSMGFTSFKIKQKKALPIGTTFTNAADIYFDYNYPIHTNMVINTLAESSLYAHPYELILKVYPNPASDKLTVETPSEWQGKALTVRCLDIMGREVSVKEEANQEKMSLNTANLPAGWYMLQVSDGKTLLTQKFGIVK